MPLVEPSDILSRLGLPTDHAKAEAIAGHIQDREADLEAFLKRPLVETVVENESVTISSDGRLYLRETPVRSVSSFTIDGDEVDAAHYTVEAWGIGDVWPGFLPSPLISAEPALVVSYVAGLPGEDPEDVFTRKARAIIIAAVIRDWNWMARQDAGGLDSLAVEGTTMKAHNPGGGFTGRELAGMTRWKKRIQRR